MLLYAEIVKGPGLGQLYPITSGLRIGRGKGNNIRLVDPKVSQDHAVVHHENGELILRDLGSRSGCLVDGQLTKRVTLKDGVLVVLGNTWLWFASQQYRLAHPLEKSRFDQASAHAIENPEQSPFTVRNIDANATNRARNTSSLEGGQEQVHHPEHNPSRNWRMLLSEEIRRAATRLKDERREISPLSPPLQLEFIAGRQLGTKWILGYGPRMVGATSFELTILEPGSPEICFKVLPGEKGPVLVIPHPGVVHLNQQSVSRAEVQDGDMISIGTTKISIKALT